MLNGVISSTANITVRVPPSGKVEMLLTTYFINQTYWHLIDINKIESFKYLAKAFLFIVKFYPGRTK